MSVCAVHALALGLLLEEASAQLAENVQYRPDQCLPGDKHKELASPEPEGPDYQACHQWRERTCCTAEFTQNLAHANVTNIDGFHWNRCGNLSLSCQQFFVRVECFYRCSPHVAHWALLQFDSALANLPVCREFCNEWFDACKDDLTCAENWITEWNYTNGENHCLEGSSCRTYRDVYDNGRGICERLWGDSFIYTDASQDDPERQCLTLWWPEGQPNPNALAITNIFEDAGATTGATTGATAGATAVKGTLCLLLAALAVVGLL